MARCVSREEQHEQHQELDKDQETEIDTTTIDRPVMNLITSVYHATKHSIRAANGREMTRESISAVKELCDRIQPRHLGLAIPTAAECAMMGSSIDYLHIHEDDMVTVGVFILPPGASIPLHDHPQMCVVSKVLYGSLVVTAFDKVHKGEFQDIPTGRKSWARLQKHEVVHAPHTTELFPSYCNFHEFTAGSDIGCAILDIFTPPYDPSSGRDCTYYQVVHRSDMKHLETGKAEVLSLLEPFHPPADFIVTSAPYKGPSISLEDSSHAQKT